MHHVFISYSRTDALWVAELVRSLTRAGVPCWVDQREIPVTVRWLDAISDAVEEADLFVTCASPAWRASEVCAAERELADAFEKPVTSVTVGGAIEEATEALQAEQRALARDLSDLTELRVRARDWDRSGRPSGDLAGLAARWDMAAAAKRLGAPTPVAGTYLSAGRRRTARRAVVGALVAVVLAAAVYTLPELYEDHREASGRREAEADASALANHVLDVIGADPYAGLSAAYLIEAEESVYGATIVSSALADPVPDDAFTVPRSAVGFAASPVGDEVIVVDAAGDRWSRGAEAGDERTAAPASGRGGRAAAPEGRWDVEIGEDAVTVSGSDGLHRTLAVSPAPTLAVVSPSGRRIAFATGDEVALFDIGSGGRRTTLRGAPGTVTDVAWSVDGTRVWATVGRHVVSWLAQRSEVIVDDPEASYRALVPSDRPDRAWLVGRDGRLEHVELGSGEVVETWATGVEVASAAGTVDGTHAVLGGDEDVIVDLATGATVDLDWEGCAAAEPALTPDAALVLVPCVDGALLVVDGEDGEVLHRWPVEAPHGVQSVVVDPSSGQVYAGGTGGQVWRVDIEDGTFELVERASCSLPVRAIVTAPAGDGLLPVGDGQGVPGCHQRGRGRGDLEWGGTRAVTSSAWSSSAAAYNQEGTMFAVGYADGSVALHPTERLAPFLVLTDISGGVRDLYRPEGTDDLYAATLAGQLVRIPAFDVELSVAALSELAGRRIARADAIGVTDG